MSPAGYCILATSTWDNVVFPRNHILYMFDIFCANQELEFTPISTPLHFEQQVTGTRCEAPFHHRTNVRSCLWVATCSEIQSNMCSISWCGEQRAPPSCVWSSAYSAGYDICPKTIDVKMVVFIRCPQAAWQFHTPIRFPAVKQEIIREQTAGKKKRSF